MSENTCVNATKCENVSVFLNNEKPSGKQLTAVDNQDIEKPLNRKKEVGRSNKPEVPDWQDWQGNRSYSFVL